VSSRPAVLDPAVFSVAMDLSDADTSGRVAVVDIGSNTVRMVVYDAPARLPIPVFNEKATCELAKGLDETGRLNPAGVTEALRSMRRFHLLSQSMGVEKMALVATAAVREAEDGNDFVARIKEIVGEPVSVLSGLEEARLSALSLLSGRPNADGLLADVGGGSVDLIELKKGAFGNSATLPLGHLRLRELAGDNPVKAGAIVAKKLANIDWLADIQGCSLFLAGGSCRALARVFIGQLDHPLHVIDGFKVRRGDTRRLCELVASLGPASLRRIPGISKSRGALLPYAAAVVGGLLSACRAKKTVFSGFGMREGQLLEMLPKSVRKQDPLLAGCAAMAERTGRFSISGEEIFDWIAPLFPKARNAKSRLRMAACMLSDIGWSEHPDYRAEHAFLRVLRLPFAGLIHRERAFLAFTMFVRYDGDPENTQVSPIRSMLKNGDADCARSIGLALRLAFTLSGAAPGLLPRTKLKVDDGKVLILLPKGETADGDIFISEGVERRLEELASSLGLKGQFG